jgi:hypothetical protein
MIRIRLASQTAGSILKQKMYHGFPPAGQRKAPRRCPVAAPVRLNREVVGSHLV